MPAALLIGAICGCLGSIFIYINTKLAILRKKYIDTRLKKIIEVGFFGFITAAIFYAVCLSRKNDCVLKPATYLDRTFQFYCPEGYYNPFASLVFNTEGGIIRQLLNVPVTIKSVNDGNNILGPEHLLVFFLVWYVWFTVTYGIHVPAGLFLPGLILGCVVGLLYMQFMIFTLGYPIDRIGGQSYVIIGAAAMLSSYSRMTYSLAVIMLETT